MIIEPEETARRVRAARGYARLTRPELAERCGLTAGQLKLLEDGRRRVTTRDELIAIGDACGVPTEFMDGGFSGVRGMYAQMAKLFGALLTQQIDEVLRVAGELGLEPSDALRGLQGELLEPPHDDDENGTSVSGDAGPPEGLRRTAGEALRRGGRRD